MRLRAHDSTDKFAKTFKLIGKDIISITTGLVISLILTIAINPAMQEELMIFFFK